MSVHFDEAEAAAWLEWVEERPEAVRDVAHRLPPWQTYRLKNTGQYCRIHSYDETEAGDCTLSVFAWYGWSGPLLGHGVFGILPDDLELRIAGGDE